MAWCFPSCWWKSSEKQNLEKHVYDCAYWWIFFLSMHNIYIYIIYYAHLYIHIHLYMSLCVYTYTQYISTMCIFCIFFLSSPISSLIFWKTKATEFNDNLIWKPIFKGTCHLVWTYVCLSQDFLKQQFSTLLLLQSFNIVPHVVKTLNQKNI